MRKSHILVLTKLLTLILLLAGCNGGSGDGNAVSTGEESSSPSGEASVGPSPSSPSPVAVNNSQISPENSLTSVYQVDVDVSLPQLASSQAYLSICVNSGGGIDTVDYDKCLLKAALQSGSGQYSLRVPNHSDSLIAIISIMEPNTTPLIYELNHNNQAQTTWLIQ